MSDCPETTFRFQPWHVPAGPLVPGQALHRHLARLLKLDDEPLSMERIAHSTCVFLCRSREPDHSVVCKFFAARENLPWPEARALMLYEYRSLERLRRGGFRGPPFEVVQPLAVEEAAGCLLVEPFVPATDLDHTIGAAVSGAEAELFTRLNQLAGFLARLHGGHVLRRHIPFHRYCEDARRILRSLAKAPDLSRDLLKSLEPLVRLWERESERWTAETTLVHGDVTPTNFLFPEPGRLVVLDLERMRFADPLLDVGFLTAELRHHFALRVHCAERAEPFVRYFLDRYCEEREFAEPVRRQWLERHRFFMALGELRIARNPRLHPGHRGWLVEEALRCLR
ncbi:MAG: hypothetical protein Kow00109_20380 [Acidobacteriota bacterium]